MYIPHNWQNGELLRAEDLNHLEQGVLNQLVGLPGKDGVSPVVFIEEIPGGHRITITDAIGSKSFDIIDGVDGKDGLDGGVTSFNGHTGAVMPETGDYTALQVTFDPGTTGMEAVNVDSAIKELFTSGSEGKSLIASAITSKGVDTAADASFQTMSDNILAIPSNELPEGVFTITVEPGQEGGGTVPGGGVAQGGMTVTVFAEPEENHIFQGWQENGTAVSDNADYTFRVTGDRALTGVFEFKKPSRLPEGYTEVEYIQSTGTQYIDTGINNFNGLDIEAVIKHEFDSTPAPQYLFGCSITSGSNQYRLANAMFANGNISAMYGSGSGVISKITPPRKITYQVLTSSKTFKANDDEFIASIAIANRTFNTMFVFAFHDSSGNKANNYSSIKLYSFDIIQESDGAYIRQYVPCVNPSGQVGLYDLAYDAFYPNRGSGEFIAGPEI